MAKKKVKKAGREAEKPQEIASYVDWRPPTTDEEIERRRRQDEIIARFVDANAAAPPASAPFDEIQWSGELPPVPTPPIPATARRRWMVPVLLAVGVVAGGLMGAAAKDRELRPTIHLLNRAMDTVAARARQFEGAATAQSVELHALRDANTRLMLEHGGAIQAMDQARDTDRAASHDLRRARTALRYDQSVDRISDRAKTWEALRAVEKAERRLNETP